MATMASAGMYSRAQNRTATLRAATSESARISASGAMTCPPISTARNIAASNPVR